jgi:methyl-accepting chemotaxis protein
VKLLTRPSRTVDAAPAGFLLSAIAPAMLQEVAINLMFADTDLVIRYANPASLRTLRSIEHLLPVPVDQIIGSSIDLFHQHPAHQRSILVKPQNLPHNARFMLGNEWLDLTVGAVTTPTGALAGFLVNWSIVTDQVRIETEIATTIAAAVEEMRASIGEISQSAAESVSVADRAATSANEVSMLMEQLDERLAAIDHVVEFIAGVADQTNLLALNATIEAARAGEVGRGFAVVAGEVKELATETDKATESIRGSVRSLQGDASAMRAALGQMADLVSSVQHNSSSIAAAVEEQTAVAQEIAQHAAMVGNGR